ncbi:MAG: hypothetical protein LIP01_00450 [Tannerellaceae bacterium]|nr:hypothetical protein [Tannerellaceae bacterium]
MKDVCSPFKIDFEYLPVVNFAMQQNNVNIIRRFVITNDSQSILRNVKITFSPDPYFFDVDPCVIESIQPGEVIRLDSVSFYLKTSLLFQITERLSGHFRMEITGEKKAFFRQLIRLLCWHMMNGAEVRCCLKCWLLL